MKAQIMVIDDDEIVLFIHETILEMMNLKAQVTYYDQAKDALKYLDEGDECCATLLFLDINMPEMSGWDLLEIIKTRPYREFIYTVMVSSSVDQNDKQKAFINYQVHDFLNKPLNVGEIEKLNKNPELSIFFEPQ